jgi:hypothetical protein
VPFTDERLRRFDCVAQLQFDMAKGGVPQTSSEPEEIRLSTDDVILCVKNARRLRKDARRTSFESRLALKELALEEVAKGYLVFFRIMVQHRSENVQVGDLQRFIQAGFPVPLHDLIEANSGLFTQEALRAAFWDHELKLGAIEFIINSIEEVMPVARPSPIPGVKLLPLRYRIASRFARSERLRARGVETMTKALATLQNAGITTLDQIGKRATYVGLSRNPDRCFLLTADRELERDLDTILSVLIIALEVTAQRFPSALVVLPSN